MEIDVAGLSRGCERTRYEDAFYRNAAIAAPSEAKTESTSKVFRI